MRGLLWKDVRLMRSYCRSVALLVVVFLAVALVSPNTFFFIYPCLIVSMIPMTLYSCDEKERFCAYCLTLPISRRQYVSGKYLLGLLSTAAMLILSVLVCLLKTRLDSSFSLHSIAGLLTASAALSFLAPAVCFPLLFRFGADKGRTLYLVVIGLTCAASAIVACSPPLRTALQGGTGAVAAVIPLLLYAASWPLAIRLYEKRDL